MPRSAAARLAQRPLPLFDAPAPRPAVSPEVRPTFLSDAPLVTIRQFDAFGSATQESVVDGIPYLVNEFWTSAQRQAHSIHEVSYRACFKPQLPDFFISRLTVPGDCVLDPFMGRGTTPVQAALMGRQPLGNDVNPLSVLLTKQRFVVRPTEG